MVATGDCPSKDVRVLVGDTEIPTVDEGVETTIRKEGNPDIKRLTDVYFPSEWRGEDILQYVEGYDNEGSTQLVRVQARPPGSDTDDAWRTLHYGYVRGVGSGGRGKKMRLVVGDFADYLQYIPADVSWDNASASQVARYVTDRLEEQVPFLRGVKPRLVNFEQRRITKREEEVDAFAKFADNYLDRDAEGAGELLTGIAVGGLELTEQIWDMAAAVNPFDSVQDDEDLLPVTRLPLIGQVGESLNKTLQQWTSKSFEPNKHHLGDVVNWFTENTLLRWWFDYDDDSDSLVFSFATDIPRQQYAMSGLDRDGKVPVRVLENNVLYDIKPFNELQIKGNSATSAKGADRNVSNPSKYYPIATARHKPLYKRNNESSLHPPAIHVGKATTVTQAKKVAQRRLKDRLDSSEGGEMTLLGRPGMLPYASIEAVPACGDLAGVDMTPLRYEVERITHKIPAREPYTCQTDVSLFVDPDDITFVEPTGLTQGPITTDSSGDDSDDAVIDLPHLYP